jgi:plastocyanin
MTSEAPPLSRPLPPNGALKARPVARRGGLAVALGALGIGVLVLTPISLLSIRRTAISEQSGAAVTVQVAAEGMRFVPNEIHVPRNAAVKVEFTNQDPATPHDFQSTGQVGDAHVVAWPGETQTVYFKAAANPGRYAFICTVRGHADAGMYGVIVVE